MKGFLMLRMFQKIVDTLSADHKVPSDASLHRKTSAQRVKAYVHNNQKRFEEAYPYLVEERYFSPAARIIGSICVMLTAPMAAKAAQNNWVLLAYTPIPILFMVVYPLINKRLSRKQFLIFANFVGYMMIASAMSSLAGFAFTGRLEYMTNGSGALFMLISNGFTFTSSKKNWILLNLFVTITFAAGIYLITPEYFNRDIRGMIFGAFIGAFVRQLVDYHLRHDFYAENERRDASAVMKSVPQGIVNIIQGRDGELYLDYHKSDFTSRLFGDFPEGNIDFKQYIVEKMDLGEMDKGFLCDLISQSLGDEVTVFNFNRHHLINEVKIERDGKTIFLELTWSYVLKEEDNSIEKILLTMTDVTEKRLLASQLEQAEVRNLKAQLLLNAGKESCLSYVESSLFLLDAIHSDVLLGKSNWHQKIAVNLHTFKGNSRTVGFAQIVKLVHELETYLGTESDQFERSTALSQIVAIKNEVLSYQIVMVELLRWRETREKVEITRKDLQNLLSINQENIDALLDSQRLSIGVKEAIDAFYPRITTIVRSTTKTLEPMAIRLAKEIPYIEINGGDIRLKEEATEVLKSVFAQLLGNSLDHGIESAEDRVLANKSPKGLITIGATYGSGVVQLSWTDDGRGLDVDGIAARAESFLGSGFSQGMTDDEKATLAFHHGLSTKEEVSEISGRGVGMTSVKKMIAKLGGTVDIELGAANEYGNRNFRILISIQSEHTIMRNNNSNQVSQLRPVA